MASPPTTPKGVLRLREKFEHGSASVPQNPKQRSLSESAHRTVLREGRNAVKPPVNAGAQPSREPGPGKRKWSISQPSKESGFRKVSLVPVTTTTSPTYAKPASSPGQQPKVKNEFLNFDKNREPSKITSSKVKIELTSSTSKQDGSKPDWSFKGKNLLVNKSAKIGVQQVEIIRSHAKDSDDQDDSQTQEKTLTVAERARIFSADEPQSSAPCQRKQRPPEFAGSQTGLAAYQWEETGSQGDDEGLTSPVGHPRGPAMNRKIKLNQGIQDNSNQPSRNRETEWNQVDKEGNSSVSRFQKMIPKWLLRNREPVRTGSQVDLRPAPKWAPKSNTQWYDTRAGGVPPNEDSSCMMSGREASRSALDSPSKSGNSQANSADAPQLSHPDNFKPAQMQPKPIIPARKTSKDSLGEAISQPVRRAAKPVLQIPIRKLVTSFESPKKVPPSSQARKERELATRQDEATVSVSSEKPNKPSPKVKQKEATFSQTCLTSAETVQKPVAMPSSQLEGNPISTSKVGDISQKSGPSQKQPSQLGIQVASKPLPDIPPTHEIVKLLNLQDPNTNNEQSSLSSDKVEDPPTNSKTETSLQDTLQGNSTTARVSQNLRKPVPAARARRRPGVTLVDGFISEPLSQVPEDEVMKISGIKPMPVPRDRKLKENLPATSNETNPLPAKPTEYHNIAASHAVEVPVVENSADVLDSKNKTTEISVEEKVEATSDTTLKAKKRLNDTNSVQFVGTAKDGACVGSGANLSKSAKKILLTHSENEDSDNEVWNTEGSDAEAEKRIIPLRENKLLLDNDNSGGLLRRTSSLDDLPVGNNLPSFSNTRGLFQRAQLLKSHESLSTTAKPPLPQKPTLPKKPPLDDTGCETGKPPLSPRLRPLSPPRAKPKTPPVIRSPKPPEQPNMGDDIYDTVCPDEVAQSNFIKTQQERTSLLKLEKVLGPGFDSGPTTETSKPQKAKKPVDLRVRKISAPAQQTSRPDDGPYAVINLPDAEKTAAKNTRNVADPKTSDGNGDKVTLRNSGGMSSGDSGIVGIHGDLTYVKRTMSKRERRMSRRDLRQKMRSIDSDFTEDSDDEPIGADSDFDSDESLEEPAEFVDDTHKQAFEVLTTERTYVDTLYLINHVFLAQIEAENEKHHWFPPTVLHDIFSNIKTIYELHSAVLLPELEKRLKEWEKKPCLGEVLKTVAPFLKLYSDYVSNFDNAMKQLNFWTSKVPKFAASIADKQKHQLCGNLALQHHMLTPIQRIPRYELLLKEYLKKLPSTSKDRPDAEKALNMISGAAQHSNNMMKSMDQFEELLKINEKIDGENIIHPTRRFLKEGKITKITAKNKESQDRYIFLFNDILLCCEKKRLLSSTTYKVKLKMEVNGMKVLDSSSCGFIIEGKNKTIEIQTSSEEEREQWMKELLSAICEMVRKKETFKTNNAVVDRESHIFSTDGFVPGKVEPRWIRDDETTMCMRCGTDFKLTKRRHHCRACGAVVCHKCSSYEAALQYDEGRENKVCFKCYFTLNGDEDELEKLSRKSLLTEIDENNSFASYLFIQHKGVWTKFWVAVTDQELYAFKAPKDVKPVFSIQITQCSVHDLTDSNAERDHVFKLSEGRTIHTLSADTRELKRRWLDVLLQGVREAARRSVTL